MQLIRIIARRNIWSDRDRIMLAPQSNEKWSESDCKKHNMATLGWDLQKPYESNSKEGPYDSVYFVSGILVPVVIEGPPIEKKIFGLYIVCKKG